MTIITKKPAVLLALAALAVPASGSLSAQDQTIPEGETMTTVYGTAPTDLSDLPEGPEIEGFISARAADKMQVTGAEGTGTTMLISEGTEVRASKGLLGLSRSKLGAESLLNGLPVTVKTVEWGGGLVASRVKLRNNDLKTAQMIRTGTTQGFAEQTAATEALRGRVGDIDQYNIKGTTNVNFDTGMAALTPQGESALCAAAAEAEAMDNALLLVVGYTDSTGSYEVNQALSEKRASRVVNHLQQSCGWKPYRMLTPTGMATADPLASNDTDYGKAQNRRVAVNILVSKGLDGL
ncbi:OmpA family protein [Altererythrobacter sp. ZODW24]|uniref:OmpA family protein n=1 Tax=Altererythrobacter sp. ZODW24 TaxID=2185142 RepID=UPI000DF849EF|nr:OmpA family protein [Altererythrobacter sp. ZODW24]